MEQACWDQNRFHGIAMGLLDRDPSLALWPAAYADVIVRARGLNAALDCTGLQHAATVLQNNGARTAVARFWPGECPVG